MRNHNMMRNNWMRMGLGISLIVFVSVQSLAVMQDAERIEGVDEARTYERLVATSPEDLAGSEADCQAALNKLDSLLREIDEVLDAGAADEESLLATRDAVAQLRLELPCLPATQLTQFPCCMPEMVPLQAVVDPATNGQVISERVIGESVIGESVVGPVDSGPGAFVGGMGGGATGGGGAAGGAAGGGGGLGRLLAIGGLTGGIIAAATSGSSSGGGETSVPEESL